MTEKALIIKKNWLDKIFNDGKCWEMRTTKTHIRGRILLIESGSGHILGECSLIDCIEIDSKSAIENIDKHQVSDYSLLKKWKWAWVIQNAKKHETPTKYKHPQGAVIWVNI